ncbi:hypothetical protein U471_31620 [Bacillus sp. CN2]|nr:hypothetical protein EFW58_01214 [Bacillus velezensis]GFR54602.1 hypothetical protein U471_31620 [Bacillus sp. CN2]
MMCVFPVIFRFSFLFLPKSPELQIYQENACLINKLYLFRQKEGDADSAYSAAEKDTL